jgi:DNA-binding PadR family transcriptional regulator
MNKSRPPGTPRELLTPAALHVLLSLAEGERHGYGIKLDVEERTGRSLVLGPGTLYEAIHRMQKAGWIEESVRRRSPEKSDPRRKYYRLTREGRERLREELERLRDIVHYAKAKALLREPAR